MVNSMKRTISIFLIITIFISLTACKQDNSYDTKFNISKSITDEELTNCSKEYVDEFISILRASDFKFSGLYGDSEPKAENCLNVTPPQVAKDTDIKIFKFSDIALSIALIENEIYPICRSLGGYGFVNAVPWDYDNDGNTDLLVASSFGSGLHRSEISVFNVITKESNIIFETTELEDPRIDLIVRTASNKDSINYEVYSVNIKTNDNNFADISYEMIEIIGIVELENGTPVFKISE